MKRIIACALCAIIIATALVGCASSKYTCRLVEEGEVPDLISTTPDESFLTDKERDQLLEKEIKSYLKGVDVEDKDFTYEILASIYGTYKDELVMLYWINVTDATGTKHFKGVIVQSK